MKAHIALVVVATVTAIETRGGPVENTIVAAMAVGERGNYTWRSTITDDARTYEIEGKTAGGFTWQRQPMPTVVARRLGRSAGDTLDAIFIGPQDYVIHTENGWRQLEELPKQHPDWNDEGDIWFVPVVAPPPVDFGGGEVWGPIAPPSVIYVPVHRGVESTQRAYSNAQFALSLPHHELAIIVSSHVSLKANREIAVGRLSNIGAQLLLVHDGHEYITPVVADGRFKLWMKAGLVVKYQLELAGLLLVDDETVLVRQKSTTQLTDVGATRLNLSRDVWKRLAD